MTDADRSAATAGADVTAVVLAAGKGTRMQSDLAKVLHELDGRPLLAHVLDTCRQVGIEQLVTVVGHQREAVAEIAGAFASDTAIQDQQLGTGHAVLVAEDAVRCGTVVVLCGDCPLVPASLLEELLQEHRANGNACTGVAADMPDPTGYGRMITDVHGRLIGIVEHKDANPAQRAITLINSGIYAFDTARLFACLHRLRPENSQGEYYLTDVVAMLNNDREPVGLVTTGDIADVLGINRPDDLAQAHALLKDRNLAR
jgi:bifunctional UDP-N-acetylglucosamine pyrophosphorylase/glucosamine-1-phosphate N-acetyltransferase